MPFCTRALGALLGVLFIFMGPVLGTTLEPTSSPTLWYQAWEGGSNDVRSGVTHVFDGIPMNSLAHLYLKVDVFVTDFSDTEEFISEISVNDHAIMTYCDPGLDSGQSYYTCLINEDIWPYIKGDNVTILTTASYMVNLQPYDGFILYVKYTISGTPLATESPTAFPTIVPTTATPTYGPTAAPSSHEPTSFAPTLLTRSPTSSSPTLVSGYSESWSGGANNVTDGVRHTFFGLLNKQTVLLRVEVIQTDYDDDNEYINGIYANGVLLSDFCHPGGLGLNSYYTCLINSNVASLVSSPNGTIEIRTTGTSKINCCQFQGYLLFVRYSISDIGSPTAQPAITPTPSQVPTDIPKSVAPTSSPSTSAPTRSPTSRPSTASPTAVPTRTAAPSTQSPTARPTTQSPTLSPNFIEQWEGGTNNVAAGVAYTFNGLRNVSSVYLKVEVYKTDFSDAALEYVSSITAGPSQLSSYCSPRVDRGGGFYTCLYDINVKNIVASDGTLTVTTKATEYVNAYKYNGFYLYVRYTISTHFSPTTQPTGQPTGQPSGQPTGQPSGQPSSQPTGLPSGQPSVEPSGQPYASPTGQPSGQPTIEPTGQPTGQPTSMPTSSMPTILPTYSEDSPFLWLGGSGNWEDGHMWNKRHAPKKATDVAIVDLGRNEVLRINVPVVIGNLSFSGDGYILFAGSVSNLTLTEGFSWFSGSLVSSSNRYAVVATAGAARVCTQDRVFLRYVELVNEGSLVFDCGSIVFSNATLYNSVGSIMTISSTVTMERDVSFDLYDESPSSILNVDANIRFNLPVQTAPFDLFAPRTLRIVQTNSSTQEYTVSAESNERMAEIFLESGAPGLVPTNKTIYEYVLENTDENACGKICTTIPWCNSFDIFRAAELCYLSRFKASDLGGLTTLDGDTNVTSHFEVRAQAYMNAEKSSTLRNDGRLYFTSAIANLDVFVAGTGKIYSVDSTVRYDRGADLTAFGTAVDLVRSSATVSGKVSFQLGTNAIVKSSTASGTLTFDGGIGVIGGGMENIHFIATDSSVVSFDSIARNHSFLSFEGRNDTVINFLSEVLINVAEEFSVSTNSSVAARNAIITSDSVRVFYNSSITADGMGFASNLGPGAGASHSTSGGGASYGGIGGSSMPREFDIELAYGDSFLPTAFGSGGGRGYGSQDGGHGGGILAIHTKTLILNGTISSRGLIGSRGGGGGGSGGSIIINATSWFSGYGNISARGGDGDNAGGQLCGGGGSGGRIALYIPSSSLFAGTVDNAGGVTMPFKNELTIKAGPGTTFVSLYSSTTGYTNALLASTYPFKNFIYGVQNRAPVESVETQESVSISTVGFVQWGAVHLQQVSDSALPFNPSLGVNLHVSGYQTCLNLAATTMRVNKLVASGYNSTIVATQSTAITFVDSAALSHVSFHVLDASVIVTSGVLNISSSARLVSYTGSSVMAPSAVHSGSGSGVISLSSMYIEQNGFIEIAPNSNIDFDCSLLNISKNGGIHVHENAVMQILDAVVNIAGGKVYGQGATSIVNVSTLSTLALNGGVDVQNVTISYYGTLVSNNGDAILASSSKLIGKDTSQFLSNGGTIDCEDNGDLLQISAASTLRTLNNADTYIYCPITVKGAITIESGSKLHFNGGGIAEAGSSLANHGECVFAARNATAEFVFELGAGASGSGSYLVRSLADAPKNTLIAITVQDSGTLRFAQYSYSIGSIFVSGGGSVAVLSSGHVSVSNLVVNGGALAIDGDFTVTATANLFQVRLTGAGELVFDTEAHTRFDAFGWSYFSGIKVVNKGQMTFSTQRIDGNGVFEFSRSALFENQGVVQIHNSSSFITGGVLTFFKKYESTQSVDTIGGETLTDIALTECARVCKENDLLITRKNGRTVEIVPMDCYGFLYNNYTRKCILQSYSRLNFLKKDERADARYRWDFYQKYYYKPYIVNKGVLTTGVDSADSNSIDFVVDVAFNNTGNLAVSNAFHAVSIMNDFSSTGNVSITGDLNVGRANSSASISVTEITAGSGTLKYIGVDVSLSAFSLIDSSTLAVTLENSSLTFLADGRKHVSVKSLELISGDILANGPLEYEVTSTLSLSGDSSIRSAVGAIASDPLGFSCGTDLCGDCSIIADDIIMKGSSIIDCAALMIQASSVSLLDSDTSISCTGRGNHLTNSPSALSAGVYSSSGSSGGSHGGTGAAGNGAASGAVTYYDSTYSPNLWGSAGGHNGGSTGRLTAGGGSMKISVTSNLTVNGAISCDGASPLNTAFGGGSGGSVDIASGKFLLGSGNITSKGGSVLCIFPDRCGSGGGGRIRVNSHVEYFSGTFSTEGGYANNVASRTGSPGTVFIIARDRGETKRSVLINSHERLSSMPTYIVDSPVGVDLDYLLVSNSAHVIVNRLADNFRVETISGDGTGIIDLANTNLVIPSGNLFVKNALVNIQDSFITASTYTVSVGGKLYLSALGASNSLSSAHYTVNSITLELGGILSLRYPDPSSNPIIILTVTTLSIDGLSTFESNGQGFPGADAVGSGPTEVDPGCGYHGSMGGSGGSLGGEGGEGMSSSSTGIPHGDAFIPTIFGSGGGGAWDGSVAGGKGGGVVRIIATTVIVNGILSADGAEGSMPGSGGGSGGSIYITTSALSGTGAISADGGAGLFSDEFLGGGGSGGRIAIYADTVSGDSFSGTITAFGGTFLSDEEEVLQFTYGDSIYEWLLGKPSRAAAGTIYRKWNTPLTTEFTVDNKGGLDTVTVAKLIDAAGKDVPLMETFALNSSFTSISFGNSVIDEISILRHAKLRSESGDDLSVSSITSDGTGDFVISRGSTVHLPSTFNVDAIEMNVGGTVLGASTLNVESGAQLSLHPGSHWCYIPGISSAACDAYSLNFTFNVVSISGSSGIVLKGGSEFAHGHQATTLYLESSLTLTDSTSYVSADAEGFTGARQGEPVDAYHGISRPDAGDGGSHAGYGGTCRGDSGYVYGSAMHPVHWGGGGGSTYQFPGMNGGGSLHIVSKGNIVNNGRISSNGQSCDTVTPTSSAGGGAGGSVWIQMIDGSASLSGSGVVSATGGNSCLGESGAGAGGRIALHETNKGSSFTGSYNVLPGVQTNSNGVYPAGGTMFWGDMNGDNGVIASTSRSSSSFETYVASNLIARPIVQTLDRIVVGNSPLIFHNEWNAILLSNGVRECATELATHTIVGCANGGVARFTNDSSIEILGSLSLSNIGLELKSGSHMYVQTSVTLGSSSNLLVSPNDTYISTTIPGAHSSVVCTTYGTYCFSDLTISNLGLFKFSGVDSFPSESNYLNVFGSLNVNSGGVIDVSGVALALLNTDKSDLPRGHGAPTNSGFLGASGGGNGGYGSTGTLNAASGSYPRNNAFRPFGAGGPGGSSSQRGGAGGGGLTITAYGDAAVSGTIRSDGVSGDLNGGNGGGAGGSLHFVVHGTLSGASTGAITVNGGHGGISQTSHVHGGAGSGGRVLVQACQSTFGGSNSALGGLSMNTIGFDPSRSYVYRNDFAADRFGSRNNDNLVAGAAGTIVIAELDSAGCAAVSTSLVVSSWKTSTYLADTSSVVTALRTFFPTKRIASSAATSLADDDTEYYCCQDPVTEILSVNDLTISYSKAKLQVESSRVLEFGTVTGTGASSLDILNGGVLKINSGNDFILNNITFNLYGTLLGTTASDISWYASKVIVHDSGLYSDGDSASTTWNIGNLLLSNSDFSSSFINISAARLDMVLGSKIDANFKGYAGAASGGENGLGPGGGGRGEFGASGGGHGGQGLPGTTAIRYESMARFKVGAFPGQNLEDVMSSGSLIDKSTGGASYGSIQFPITPGSGGGSALGPYGQGGSGGGVIIMKVAGDVSMSADSIISANGENQYKGGGGGAGGSINIGCTRLLGNGVITTNGGCTCPDASCSLGNMTFPGGAGGGGRVAVFGDISSFGGTVVSKPGCGTLDIVTASIPEYLGSIFTSSSFVTPFYRENYEGVTAKFIDVTLKELPLTVLNTIQSCGSGEGDISSDNQRNAIIRGYWRISFRSEWSSMLLSSQASANDVFASLKNISELANVAFKVTRAASACNGWIWRVIFFDSVNRFGLEVDSKSLHSTDNNVVMTVTREIPSTRFGEAWNADQNVIYDDSDISDIVQFSKSLGAGTTGYWSDIDNFRVIPGDGIADLTAEIGSLKLTYFRPIPTLRGALSGYTNVVLQTDVA